MLKWCFYCRSNVLVENSEQWIFITLLELWATWADTHTKIWMNRFMVALHSLKNLKCITLAFERVILNTHCKNHPMKCFIKTVQCHHESFACINVSSFNHFNWALHGFTIYLPKINLCFMYTLVEMHQMRAQSKTSIYICP